MRTLIAAVGLTLVFGAAALAQPKPLAGERPDIDRMAGVYKHRFANGTVDGDHYRSEDIFEVVRLSPTAAYFRIHTEFYNGHTCGLWGVADLTDDALTYTPREPAGPPCVMKFTTNKDGVIFNDVDGVCRNWTCGMRGGYGYGAGVDFQPMNKNYGLLPPMETPRRGPDGKPIPLKQRGREKKKLMSERALRDLDAWLAGRVEAAAE